MMLQPSGVPIRLTIGTLSDRASCNTETIRYYERIGLMPRTARTVGVSMTPEDRVRWDRLRRGRGSSEFVRTCAT